MLIVKRKMVNAAARNKNDKIKKLIYTEHSLLGSSAPDARKSIVLKDKADYKNFKLQLISKLFWKILNGSEREFERKRAPRIKTASEAQSLYLKIDSCVLKTKVPFLSEIHFENEKVLVTHRKNPRLKFKRRQICKQIPLFAESQKSSKPENLSLKS